MFGMSLSIACIFFNECYGNVPRLLILIPIFLLYPPNIIRNPESQSRHTMPIIRLLGLKIALAFLKGSIDQRRAITSLNGFRADVEVAKQRAAGRNTDANSPDTDIVSTATEVLDRWKIASRRRG